MVADWFVLGVVDGCLPDSADTIHGMDSRRLRRELKPMAHFKHREDIGDGHSQGKPVASRSGIDQVPAVLVSNPG
jgi:hypothetical protein